MLTLGVDRQETHYKWLVSAWGPTSRAHVVDYGEATSLEILYQQLILRDWPYEDRHRLRIGGTLIDCGYLPKEPCELSYRCLYQTQPRQVVLVCRGASGKLYQPFKMSTLGAGTTMPGLPNVLVDGDWTQTEIDKLLYELRPGQDGSLSLCAGSLDDHEALVKELVNDMPETKLDSSNHTRVRWNRPDEGHPNDFRDCWRYGYVAHLIRAGGQAVRPRVVQVVAPPTALTPARRGVVRPDGRPYLPR
ncbi:MAG: phage terminase large subunit family protein, partial [Pirellulales bacterium]|nr:phage terminase large subunit family protein [Pirellulales bacterium]